MATLDELIWRNLNNQIASVKDQVKSLDVKSERSETASGHPVSTLALAPLAAQGARAGDQYWISNGRKVGEGAGAGTGVLCYYNPNTDSWYSPASDTAVTV